MPRKATRQVTTVHPIYPDHVRLIEHRKANRSAIEVKYRLSTGWSGYRVVGHTMPDAIRASAVAWAQMEAGTDFDALPAGKAGRPRTKPERTVKQANKGVPRAGTFAAAAILLIKDIDAEKPYFLWFEVWLSMLFFFGAVVYFVQLIRGRI